MSINHFEVLKCADPPYSLNVTNYCLVSLVLDLVNRATLKHFHGKMSLVFNKDIQKNMSL